MASGKAPAGARTFSAPNFHATLEVSSDGEEITGLWEDEPITLEYVCSNPLGCRYVSENPAVVIWYFDQSGSTDSIVVSASGSTDQGESSPA